MQWPSNALYRTKKSFLMIHIFTPPCTKWLLLVLIFVHPLFRKPLVQPFFCTYGFEFSCHLWGGFSGPPLPHLNRFIITVRGRGNGNGKLYSQTNTTLINNFGSPNYRNSRSRPLLLYTSGSLGFLTNFPSLIV